MNPTKEVKMKTKDFIRTTLLGGLIVILPLAIIAGVFGWVYGLVTGWIQPLTGILLARLPMKEFLADVIVVLIIVIVCFIVGSIVRTKVGRFIHETVEQKLFKMVPGYSMVKEIVLQFLGSKKSPYSLVALAQIFGNETMVIALVTEEHEEDDYVTVFVPTGPNPTSGNIYVLPKKFVHPVDVPVENTMRMIISCGAGSAELVSKFVQARRDAEDTRTDAIR